MTGSSNFHRGSMLVAAAWLLISSMADTVVADPMRFSSANTLIKRAAGHLEKSAAAEDAETKQNEQLAAREIYAKALVELERLEEKIAKELQNTRAAGANPNRNVLQAELLQTKMMIPALREEWAEAYADQERTRRLQQAANNFEDVYMVYRRRVAGLYARVYQGRCLAKLRQFDEAMSAYEDILQQPDDRSFAHLKSFAMALASETWCNPAVGKYDLAINRLDGFLRSDSFRHLKKADKHNIRLHLARAYKLQAESLVEKNPDDLRAKTAFALAKMRAETVAESENEFTDAAKQLLEEIAKQMP